MSVNIRYPNITGLSEKEQLSQVKSFLIQLVDQLNYALPMAGNGDGTEQSTASKTYEVQGGDMSFYELRSYIVQEQTKINAEFEKLSNELEEGYIKDEELPAAIDEALAQAKASGEFDGEDGYTPVKGTDYYTEADKQEMVNEVLAASENDIVLADRTTGTKYEIYVVDGKLKMEEAASTVTEAHIVLKDHTTGIKYEIYVSEGNLTMGEVEE